MGTSGASPGVRRSYQPVETALDELVDVLCLLLTDTSSRVANTPDSAESEALASTCFKARNE